MNTQIVDALVRRANGHQNRRASLAALSAMALAAATASAPFATEAKKKTGKKARRKARKEVERTCQLQVPTCETALSAVCQPGPDVQECLDNTSACCELLATCDAQAALECVVFRFIVP